MTYVVIATRLFDLKVNKLTKLTVGSSTTSVTKTESLTSS